MSRRRNQGGCFGAPKMYLSHREHKPPPHGKVSVKKLLAKDQGAKTIEVSDENIRLFKKVTGRYNVDFAFKRDKTVTSPKYIVFFKAKDADVITQAFKEFVRANEKKKQRASIKAKMKQMESETPQKQDREHTREKEKDRGQSL